MENETVMIHTTTGAILSVDYWTFRELIGEAGRTMRRNNEDPKYLHLCNDIQDHLIKTR